MKRFRSCVAVLLSVILLFTTQQFSALASESLDAAYEEDILTEISGESDSLPTVDIISDEAVSGEEVSDILVSDDPVPDEMASDNMADEELIVDITDDTYSVVTEDHYKITGLDVLYFNTGDVEYRLVPGENDKDDNRAYSFDSEGNFNIPICEENPFFPYQVQFRSGDETWTEWFVTPSSTIEINGHLIGVKLLDEAYTSVTLNVGGRDIIVYPEEKTFTDQTAFSPDKSLSLQPLTEKILSTVDLTECSPAELTMVSTSVIFAGENVSGDVVWNYLGSDDYSYTISHIGDIIDISCRTFSSSSARLEMIVGKADQLAPDNIRYLVPIQYTTSRYWLDASAAVKSADGKRAALIVYDSYPYYYDYRKDDRYITLHTTLPSDYKYKSDDVFYVSLSNGTVFPAAASVRFYEGAFTDVNEAVKSTDITSKLWNTDPESKDGGYEVKKSRSDVTMVTRDDKGNVTGCLPFYLDIHVMSNEFSETSQGSLSVEGMYDEGIDRNVEYTTSYSTEKNTRKATVTLYKDHAATGTYKTCLNFYYRSQMEVYSSRHNEMVVAAYEGDYATQKAATAAKAPDIKDRLFASSYREGYSGVFDKGKTFSVFVKDGEEIVRYSITITNVEGGRFIRSNLSSDTAVTFTGLKDKNGKTIDCYAVNTKYDSYGEFCYRTIIVKPDTDLTNVAPTFYTNSSYGVKLYEAGGSTPIESGKSFSDFSNGKTHQYTAASEDHNFQTNYWLQVIQQKEDVKLFINSFGDKDSDYKVDEKGVIRASREVFLDSLTDEKHSILVFNMGSQPLKKVKAELSSDTLEVDKYWTLSGNYDLSPYSGVERTTNYGELANLARIIIRAKDGVESGADVSGTLTLSSEGKTIAVIKLTGILGDPVITTTEVPDAVKYVHYGTMIMNNNKYKWNRTSYTLKGTLPKGLALMENGEIYGVPTETGEFTFSITMENSYNFNSCTRKYTLKVLDNTDANVAGSTSENYDVTQKIPDFNRKPDKDYTFVSKGLYQEFLNAVNVTLDGKLLKPGTDYTHESGSTRITISKQTLAQDKGTHTISVEFRNSDNELNKAAQNYHITGTGSGKSDSGNSDSGNKDSGNKGSGSSGSGNKGSGSTGWGVYNLSGSGSGSSGSGSSSSGSSGSGDILSNSLISGSSAAASTTPITGDCIRMANFTGNTITPKGNVPALNVSINPSVQGPAAQMAFAAGTPAGFRQAMTFNMLIDGGINYNVRTGRLVITLKPEAVKTGRMFGLVGLDKNGQPHVFADIDMADGTVTCDISLAGYAFSLIYSDGLTTAGNLNTNSAAGVYVVQPRDTLSKIAKRFGTTVSALVKKNNITNPNRIYPNQVIHY